MLAGQESVQVLPPPPPVPVAPAVDELSLLSVSVVVVEMLAGLKVSGVLELS
jgi:hypothetical protein